MVSLKEIIKKADFFSKPVKLLFQNEFDFKTISGGMTSIGTLVFLLAYGIFNTQKISLVDAIKTSNKLILDKIENMQLNSVKKILNKNGFFQMEDDFKCKHCNTFAGKNKASLGAHIRNCKFNPINK